LRTHALTVDLEEWYHSELLRTRVPAGFRQSLLRPATIAILDLLACYNVKATFFVVGQVAEEHPELLQEIAAAGHEIGCHGSSHRPLWEMTPAELEVELRRFADAIEPLHLSLPVIGFRAPTWSLDNRSAWAVEVLASWGYQYDSSVFPIRTFLYGVNGCPPQPYRLSSTDVTQEDPAGLVVEFPAVAWRVGPWRVPVCGGFYLRALPWRLIRLALEQVGRRQPFFIYIHPWDLVSGAGQWPLGMRERFITYYNNRATETRLRRLLQHFRFTPMASVLKENGFLS